jgi:hypothetical protein
MFSPKKLIDMPVRPSARCPPNQKCLKCKIANNIPHTLAALAADKVAAAVLLDGLEAFGAALGVGEDPLDVLSLGALGIPFLPYGARAR